jgi:hypothetical protein
VVRRQSERARVYQDAFLHDLYTNWEPRDAREVWYDRVSRLTHLGVRLFYGGPTLAPIAVAALPTAIGCVFFAAGAGTITDKELAPGAPSIVFVVLVAGLIGLITEVIRSPRTLRMRRFTMLVALPMGVGLTVDGLMTGGSGVGIVALRAGLLAFGVALLGMPFARTAGAKAPRLVVALLRLAAAGCFLIAFTQAYLAFAYGRAGYELIAIGQVLVTVGALLLTAAFARARPTIAFRQTRRLQHGAE